MEETKIYSDFIKFKKKKPMQFYYFKNVFNKHEIDTILQYVNDMELLDGTLARPNISNKVNSEYRRSKLCWFPKIQKYKWLYEKLGQLANKANDLLWDFDITGMAECIQYAEYDQNYKGYYDWHTDVGNAEVSKRKISISVQLSDPSEYEGGELQFFYRKDIVTVEKAIGTAIFFPSYFLHKVQPITKGIRKSLVLWISGPPFR